MVVDGFQRYGRIFPFSPPYYSTTEFKEVPMCLVRKDHICGKFLGASKSCFVACPDDEELGMMLTLLEEKLTKIGIEPIIAVRDRAYGQDIFCTKICGKIIESQFCIVILDDVNKSVGKHSLNVPNPNVYYEYGIMTALNKHIIPLQKEGHELAFNIQTHDTIKYTGANISKELDKALRDAVKHTTEDRSGYKGSEERQLNRLFSRCLELHGYIRRNDYDWFLHKQIEDTLFVGHSNQDSNEILLFAYINDKGTLQDALLDMSAINKRLKDYLERMEDSISSKKSEIDKIEREGESAQISVGADGKEHVPPAISMRSFRMLDRVASSKSEIEKLNSKVEAIKNGKFAIVLGSSISSISDKIKSKYEQEDSTSSFVLPLFIGDKDGITINQTDVLFKAPVV